MSLSTSELATLFDELRASGVLTVQGFVEALNARGVLALDDRLWTPTKVSRALSAIAIDRDRISADETGGATEPAKQFLPQSQTEAPKIVVGKSDLLEKDERRAQQLLEATNHSIEAVATATGLGTATTLRRQFKRVVGIPPNTYRTSFRSP